MSDIDYTKGSLSTDVTGRPYCLFIERGKMISKMVQELKKAINTEVEGYHFYLIAANLVKDEKGKEVLNQLIKDELNHIKALTSLSTSLEEKGRWVTYEEAVDLGISTGQQKAPIFPDKGLIPELLGNSPSDVDVLNFGIEIEKKAINYYLRALENAKDEDEESFFSTMVNVEKGHLDILRWESDYVTRSGFWCDFREYTVEGER